VLLGLVFATVGTDIHSGVPRFTFGLPGLSNGFEFAALAMGIFGVTEIVMNLEQRSSTEVFTKNVTHLYPTAQDLRQSAGPIVRGTLLGSTLGILPGGGAMLSSFGSYVLEKKLSRTPERFGHGAIEGVAGPESANNAGAQASFIPMLTLGIPSNPVMALMIGALIMHGIQPGPQVMVEQPALFWGLVVSMWIGNLFLLVLNLPLIGLWVKMISVPYHLLFPAILVFCGIGVFSLSNAPFDVYLMALFGVLGYIFRKLDCEPAPMLLGFILGPMMEEYLRRAMLISKGSAMVLVTRPISATLLVLSAVILVVVLLPTLRKKREEAFQE
jgi:putative tricarboxylic transport membrane protein